MLSYSFSVPTLLLCYYLAKSLFFYFSWVIQFNHNRLECILPKSPSSIPDACCWIQQSMGAVLPRLLSRLGCQYLSQQVWWKKSHGYHHQKGTVRVWRIHWHPLGYNIFNLTNMKPLQCDYAFKDHNQVCAQWPGLWMKARLDFALIQTAFVM